ncbi:MAG: Uma2 family endonuclease [Bacteroidetes bacterium]|nr:Uma2 family endonuclease [Bacteroidota bacterium]
MIDYTEKILNSPDAPQQIEALNKAWHEEQQRRLEFRNWITPGVKAEFINGEVILHSPVKHRHWRTTDLLSRLASIYVGLRKLGTIGTEKVLVGLSRNDYEPDLVFFKKEKAEKFTDDQMIFPAPDFVVEILSGKTASRDRGVKKSDYAAHGVQEYWIIDPLSQFVEQYLLEAPEDKKYGPARVHAVYDQIESRAIEGFSIPVAALFVDSTNLEVIQQWMKSFSD